MPLRFELLHPIGRTICFGAPRAENLKGHLREPVASGGIEKIAAFE